MGLSSRQCTSQPPKAHSSHCLGRRSRSYLPTRSELDWHGDNAFHRAIFELARTQWVPARCTHQASGSRIIFREVIMLYWAAVFLVIAIVAALLGFTGVAAAAAGIAKFLFFLFLVMFLIFLVLGISVGKKVT